MYTNDMYKTMDIKHYLQFDVEDLLGLQSKFVRVGSVRACQGGANFENLIIKWVDIQQAIRDVELDPFEQRILKMWLNPFLNDEVRSKQLKCSPRTYQRKKNEVIDKILEELNGEEKED